MRVLLERLERHPCTGVHAEVCVRDRLQVRSRDHQLSDEVLLDIRTPLAALDAQPQHSDVSFALLDTPGPNEYGEEALRFQVPAHPCAANLFDLLGSRTCRVTFL